MRLAQRLEDRARTAARTARAVARRSLEPSGPVAVYARNLDGSHLWLAVPEGEGEPALRVPGTGEIVDPGSDLPAGTDAGAGLRSVRWPLEAAVPPADGAVLEVVVRAGSGGGLRPVLAPQPHPDTPGRNPTTPDGRWRFVLDGRPGEPLSVRRTALAPESRLLDISISDGVVTLLCEPHGPDPTLLLVGGSGATTLVIPGTRTEAGLVTSFSASDLPEEQASYRVHVGTDADHVPLMRRHSDLRLPDATNVLLPMLTDESGDRVAARMRFAVGGALWVHRLGGSEPVADADDA